MTNKQKLELTWIDKEKRHKVEPRIFIEDKSKSYGDPASENMLIHGDNLIALKALQQNFVGKIKCIYCDPPYNINTANGLFEDSIAHSEWLSLMAERLRLLSVLLSDDGVILVQINKELSAYLKMLMDEVFTSEAYITTIAVRMSATSGYKIKHSDKTIVKNVEYIHVYSRNLKLKPAYEEVDFDTHYSSIIKPIGNSKFKISNLVQENFVIKEFGKYKIHASIENLSKLYKISDDFQQYVLDNKELIGRTHTAPTEVKKEKDFLISELQSEGDVIERQYSGKRYFIKRSCSGFDQFIPISLKFNMVDSINGYSMKLSNLLGDWWDGFYLDMGNVDNEGGVDFKNSKKPERLLFRILNMFTDVGDYVLDSFLGSGTTAAVAHKMGRKWIGVELGDHAYTLCKPRLDAVVDGKDSNGISSFVNWHGGGGFHFYEVGESLIKYDPWGHPIINKTFNQEMLSQAICKIEGFVYAPSTEEYFIHGHSSEQDFIFVTPYFMRKQDLQFICEHLGSKRSLLIYCRGYEKFESAEFLNITIKKIPQTILKKYEWDRDDYSINHAYAEKSGNLSFAEQGLFSWEENEQ